MRTSDAVVPEVTGLDIAGLSEMLKSKRVDAGMSVRQTAASADVSFMTLSRIESGAQPDLATFVKLCAWLNVDPGRFLLGGPRREEDTVDVVTTHLIQDPRLDTEAAQRIASVVRDMYDVLARQLTPRPTVACHLRAATLLRPGVPERLGSLLHDMLETLVDRESRGAL